MCNTEKVLITTDHWRLTGNKTKDGLNCRSLRANRFGISTEMYPILTQLFIFWGCKREFCYQLHSNRNRLLMSFDSVSQPIKWKGLYLFHGSINTLILALHAELYVFDSRVLLKLIDELITGLWARPVFKSFPWQQILAV